MNRLVPLLILVFVGCTTEWGTIESSVVPHKVSGKWSNPGVEFIHMDWRGNWVSSHTLQIEASWETVDSPSDSLSIEWDIKYPNQSWKRSHGQYRGEWNNELFIGQTKDNSFIFVEYRMSTGRELIVNIGFGETIDNSSWYNNIKLHK